MAICREDYSIRLLSFRDAKEFVDANHYLGSLPRSCSKMSFGLFIKDRLQGVCAFGATSYPVDISTYLINGEGYRVVELRRLVTLDGLAKNSLSWFVSRCLKQLPFDVGVVVSYADSSFGHTGAIYKGLNFVQTGQTSRDYHYEDSVGKIIHKRNPWQFAHDHQIRTERGKVDEAGVALALGLTRVEDLPKLTFVRALKRHLVLRRHLCPEKSWVVFAQVYGLCDPDSGNVLYVGKTMQTLKRRLSIHLSDAAGCHGFSPREEWIRSLLALDKKPTMCLLEVVERRELNEKEMDWIEYLTDRGYELLNSTKGGDGVGVGEDNPNAVLSDAEVEELRLRVAAGETLTSLAKEKGISIPSASDMTRGASRLSAGGPIALTRKNPNLKGFKHTEVAKENMKKAAQLKSQNPEFSKKISAARQASSGLTDETISWMRDRYRIGDVDLAEIAKEVGKSTSVVHRAITGQTWQHVSTPPVEKGTIPVGRRKVSSS